MLNKPGTAKLKLKLLLLWGLYFYLFVILSGNSVHFVKHLSYDYDTKDLDESYDAERTEEITQYFCEKSEGDKLMLELIYGESIDVIVPGIYYIDYSKPGLSTLHQTSTKSNDCGRIGMNVIIGDAKLAIGSLSPAEYLPSLRTVRLKMNRIKYYGWNPLFVLDHELTHVSTMFLLKYFIISGLLLLIPVILVVRKKHIGRFIACLTAISGLCLAYLCWEWIAIVHSLRYINIEAFFSFLIGAVYMLFSALIFYLWQIRSIFVAAYPAIDDDYK